MRSITFTCNVVNKTIEAKDVYGYNWGDFLSRVTHEDFFRFGTELLVKFIDYLYESNSWDGESIDLRAVSVYSNTTEKRRAIIERISASSVEQQYQDGKNGRIPLDSYKLQESKDDEDDFNVKAIFGGYSSPLHVVDCEFYIRNGYGFMIPNEYSPVVKTFYLGSENLFDGWKEVPRKITGMSSYPIGFDVSYHPFDMQKYGNTIIVTKPEQKIISDDCLVVTEPNKLLIVGKPENGSYVPKLIVEATGNMQPAIGVITHTGQSYGRWSIGRGYLPSKIVLNNCKVSLRSVVPNFTIGKYGTNDLCFIEMSHPGLMDAPEALGTRVMTVGPAYYAGSTKLSNICKYEVE